VDTVPAERARAQRVSGFTGASPPWHVERREVSAQAAHDDDLFARSGRKMRVFVPAAPAVVLGSTQRDDIVDRAVAAARGLAIARRRSGGGAVLVDATVVWIDFAIGRDDPLWIDDVGASMHWVGDLWSAALARVGIDASVHRTKPVFPALARAICFCGVGHGEVMVGSRKVVGVSQRRVRAGARFQTMLMTRRDEALIDVLQLDDRDAARRAYDDAVYIVERDSSALVDAVIEQLSAT
jgi:lipoate-protein ligase A